MDEIINKLRGKVKKIAIMGGTFDPIHYGHLVTAETVRIKYNFDKILFIPSGIPPHKSNSKVTSSELRYAMVKMAIDTNPYFEVSRMEIDRKGSTYTVDTIRELRVWLGDTVDIYFITGVDAILEIFSWKNTRELMSICKFIAVTRPGYDRKLLDAKVMELNNIFKCKITIIDVPAFAISSTQIRESASIKRSFKYLVPENVEQYILTNKLYLE